MKTLVLAHGGTAGILVESLILVVPIVILCLFMLATRKPRKQEEPGRPEAEEVAGDGAARGSAPGTDSARR